MMEDANTDRSYSDDIVSAKGAYALAVSLFVGLMFWGGVFALIL